MKRFKWLIALFAVLALVAAACGGDDSTSDTGDGDGLSGKSVTIFGPESSDEEAGGVQDALNVLSARTGIRAFYTGARDFSDQINAQAAGGNPPDIAIFPQPGKVADFAREGFLAEVPSDIADAAADAWPASWMAFGEVDGTQYALPNKSDLKSIVWYKPARFAELGYEIPESWDELKALTTKAIADGNTPWCVGIESGPATGWTFTDWVEDLTLRFEGADFYDTWVDHTVPFNSPEMATIWNEILDLWNTEGAVYAAGGSIAATPFGDNGEPLANDQCLMHRQASFFSAFYPEGTSFGEGGEVDVFYFPSVGDDRPVLVAGTVVGAFKDAPEVWAVMEYFASAEYAEERQKAQTARKEGGLSGFLTANGDVDLSVFQPIEQSFIGILTEGDPARFDGSDLMPAAVGSGSFWTEATSAVNGDKTVQEALDAIQASWP